MTPTVTAACDKQSANTTPLDICKSDISVCFSIQSIWSHFSTGYYIKQPSHLQTVGDMSVRVKTEPDSDPDPTPSQLRMSEGEPWKERDFFDHNKTPWKPAKQPTEPGFEIRNDPTRQPDRAFPKALKPPKFKLPPDTDAALARIRKGKSARDPDSKVKICPSNYTAMEIHGFYGIIDDGPVGSSAHMLILHVPKWVRGYQLEIKDGDSLPVAHIAGKSGGTLQVLETGRHKYYSPGQKVTTCTVVVPEEQWARFSDK